MKGIVKKTIAVWLIAGVFVFAAANPGVQGDPEAAEKVRLQIEGFKKWTRLKVTLNDGSKKVGCLSRAEQDRFLIGSGPHGPAESILYGDVADVRKDRRGPLQNVLRAVVSVGVVSAAVFGVMKLGSNTPRTMAVKVPAAFGVAFIGGQAAAAQNCR